MPCPLTENEYMHSCVSCNYPCDCEESPDDCRECWYCNEERFDRMYYEDTEED